MQNLVSYKNDIKKLSSFIWFILEMNQMKLLNLRQKIVKFKCSKRQNSNV